MRRMHRQHSVAGAVCCCRGPLQTHIYEMCTWWKRRRWTWYSLTPGCPAVAMISLGQIDRKFALFRGYAAFASTPAHVFPPAAICFVQLSASHSAASPSCLIATSPAGKVICSMQQHQSARPPTQGQPFHLADLPDHIEQMILDRASAAFRQPPCTAYPLAVRQYVDMQLVCKR
jgi:hypothetical protein